MEELLAAQQCGVHVEHFMGELMRAPRLSLEFLQVYPASMEVQPHVRLRPPLKLRVLGQDRKFFAALAVLVHAVQDTIEVTNALEGTLEAHVKEDEVATFADVRFATTSMACGGLPFRLAFTLCVRGADVRVTPIAGVEKLFSGEFHVSTKRTK